MTILAFAIIAAVFLAVLWRQRSRLGFGEQLEDFVADVLTWCRTWTWRKVVLQLGLYCIAIGQRLMEIGQRPETPSGAKLNLKIQREWERKPIVLQKAGATDVLVMAGGRVIRFKR